MIIIGNTNYSDKITQYQWGTYTEENLSHGTCKAAFVIAWIELSN